MRVTWHAPIEVDDGVVLRADVYRPVDEGRWPAILTYGVYGKGLAFQEGYPAQWEKMVADYPEVTAGSTSRYMNWETTDPERWVPDGYAVVRVDSRGAGCLPGFWRRSRLGRPGTSISASSGRRGSRGARARWACWASPTTPPTSGR
jgi:predicted acyl esterase